MKIITRIRQKVEAGDYIVSDHLTFDKLAEVGFEREDFFMPSIMAG